MKGRKSESGESKGLLFRGAQLLYEEVFCPEPVRAAGRRARPVEEKGVKGLARSPGPFENVFFFQEGVHDSLPEFSYSMGVCWDPDGAPYESRVTCRVPHRGTCRVPSRSCFERIHAHLAPSRRCIVDSMVLISRVMKGPIGIG